MLLILREEILCLVILCFLISYYILHKMPDRNSPFLRLSIYGLIHVVFDIITVITVNHRDVVPDSLNRLLHILFYSSGILFILSLFHYILRIALPEKKARPLHYIGQIPFLIFLLILLFLPMEYVDTPAVSFSSGPLAYLGYTLFLLYSVSCLALILIFQKNLDNRVKNSFAPMTVVLTITVLVHAFIPHLLMTGGAATLVCLGLFVSLDNPDKGFQEQALWDFLTGLKNRNSFDRDLELYLNHRKRNKNSRIGFVVADMNYLKELNDRYGHIEGDRMLIAAAKVLQENLKTALTVYRMGGDEFTAVYLDPNDNVIAAEMARTKAACQMVNASPVPLTFAIGYSSGLLSEGVEDILQRADRQMYADKIAVKSSSPIPPQP